MNTGSPSHHSETDVLVIGGGPAGLATAIAARQKGFSVIVADSDHPPIDKPCGEGLMSHAVETLRQLGVAIPPHESFAFHGIRFVDESTRAEARFPHDFSVGVRRTTLHRILFERASTLSVDFRWKTRVTQLREDGAYLNNKPVRARWIVGADGFNSSTRRLAGLDSQFFAAQRFGYRRHFRIAPWTDSMELYWGTNFQIYATPVSDDEVGIAVISNSSKFRIDQALPKMPSLWSRLRNANASSLERGAVTVSRALRRVVRGNVALVGDSSGSVDAITGEGLCLSFRQALALSDAFVQNDLSLYQKAHRKMFRKPMLSAGLLLFLARNDWARKLVLRTFSADPALFASLMARHLSEHPSPYFFRRGVLPLTYQLLRNCFS